ncbi:MAG: MFS transporter [Actinomycetota bacterium]|nr:MFS transporter [Actinomycetota bacterium]
MTAAETGTGRYRDALRVVEFRAIALSSLVSILGDSAAYLAVTVLVYQRTGSALLSSLTFAVAFVPYLFGGTLLSGLVDRWPPKRLLVGCDLVAATLVVLMAIPGMPIATAFIALFLVGTLAPVRSGAASAIVADILPGDAFVPGRSVMRIIAQSAQIVGAAAGGALLGFLSPQGALMLDAVSFVISAGVITGVLNARPAAGPAVDGRLVAGSLAGLRDVWAQPRVRRLLLLSWLVSFVAVAPEGLAAPAVAHSGYSSAYVGLWLTAIPVGTVAGDLLFVWFVPSRYRQRLTWPLALAVPGTLAGFLAAPDLPLALALLVISGAMSAYGLGLDQALRSATPPSLLARTYALSSAGLMAIQGAGFAAAGALGDQFGPSPAIATAGLAGVAAVAMLRVWRAGS